MPSPEQTVYSYLMPEVRVVVEDVLRYDAEKIGTTLRQNYKPGLDDYHEPLMDKFVQHARANGVVGWGGFPHRYYTNGSSEAIFHLLAQHSGSKKTFPLYQLEGEYQGYGEYAKALGLHFTNVSETQAVADYYYTQRGQRPHYKPGLFFLSHPSARDGNLLDSTLLTAILDRHKVVLDFAYLGMTRELDFDLSHPNIVAVTASMSKPFGLYYFRSGFLWTRDPVPSLYGNRWFKNIVSIRVAEVVLDHVPSHLLRADYRLKQERAVLEINNKFSLDGYDERNQIVPSDVWLLANLKREPSYAPPDFAPYRRDDRYRFCLTPYYMDDEDQPIGDSR